MIDGFKERLNVLSEVAESENVDRVLQEANTLYGYYSHFFNLYKHHAPPEIKILKSLTRQIMLNGENQNWTNTDKLLEQMQAIWLTAKSRMENADIALNEKIDCAIDDLASVAKNKKSLLVRLKGGILLQNLDQVK